MKKLILTIALCFLSTLSFAKIAVDVASNSAAQGVSTSYSWSHTVTGKNTILILSEGIRNGGVSVTGATYGGVPLQFINRCVNGTRVGELWYLINPPTGSNTMTVNLSAAPTDSVGELVSLTGVAQAGPLGNTANNADASAPTVTLSTSSANDWIVDAAAGGNALTGVGGSQVSQNNVTLNAGGRGQSTLGPISSPSSQTMSWTMGVAITSCSTAVVIHERLPSVINNAVIGGAVIN